MPELLGVGNSAVLVLLKLGCVLLQNTASVRKVGEANEREVIGIVAALSSIGINERPKE